MLDLHVLLEIMCYDIIYIFFFYYGCEVIQYLKMFYLANSFSLRAGAANDICDSLLQKHAHLGCQSRSHIVVIQAAVICLAVTFICP